jgi:DNA-directed RNA polymerase specialized sigma24 family protein
MNNLAKLTEEEKIAVIYHHERGFSFKEIAEEMSKTHTYITNAARMACRRGMAKLKAARKKEEKRLNMEGKQ